MKKANYFRHIVSQFKHRPVMKKQLIAAAVGAVLLFVWQFLTWSVLPTHQSEYGYSANQDKIMEFLNQNLTEEGVYMMPGVPPGASHEEAEAAMKNGEGKPWASIAYHKSMELNMGMNMFRGLAVDVVAVWLLVWLLLQFRSLDMLTALKTSVAVGFIGYLTITYTHSIWFEERTVGHLIDAIVSWGLVGAWLGWWLPRE